MRRAIWCLAAAALIGLSGCVTENQSTANGPIPSDAKIEELKDPPITADTHYAAGQLAESSNDLDKAMSQYHMALQIDAKHAKSLFRIGVLQAQAKDYQAAIETWKRYLDATGHAATGWANLGFCYELSGQPNLAEFAYKSGIDRDPHDVTCHVNYGLMLARLGKPDEALREFSAVLTPAESHYNLASVFEQIGKKGAGEAGIHASLGMRSHTRRCAGPTGEPKRIIARRFSIEMKAHGQPSVGFCV